MEDLVASTLSSTLKIPHAVARFLVSRGIKTVSDAYHMLCSNESDVHDPFLMMGMDKAVEWILAVRERGERVFIFGDYDLDGMTSVTLLTRCLKTVGIESEWRLPNRFGDGYGLSVSAVDEMYEAGARNLITVDTGITANVEIAHAKELGMAVMVMDHHQPSGDGLPVSDVLLDPHQEGDNYPNPELCGVGVSYKFICALFSRLGIKAPVEYLDLVALGTLADLVQMTPENRYFTRTGLESLKSSRWPGVQEMYSSLMKPHSCVGGIDVMYKLAPLLNAPGRMERPDPALKLLLCENKGEAGKLLDELKDWNARRKQKEAEITEMAMEQVKALYGDTIPTVIVVAGENWHVGVIGIVAAKLAQEFHRPSAVLSIIVVVVFVLFYHRIFAVTFDENFARATAWHMRAPVQFLDSTGTRHFLTAVNFLTAGAATRMRRDSRSKQARLMNSAGAFCSLQKTKAIPARSSTPMNRTRTTSRSRSAN